MNSIKLWKKLKNKTYVVRKVKSSEYWLWIPQWASYDTRRVRTTSFIFGLLSLTPWWITNPFNGYLVRKNKWFRSDEDLSNFIQNPYNESKWNENNIENYYKSGAIGLTAEEKETLYWKNTYKN